MYYDGANTYYIRYNGEDMVYIESDQGLGVLNGITMYTLDVTSPSDMIGTHDWVDQNNPGTVSITVSIVS